jgi:hypothetical protein
MKHAIRYSVKVWLTTIGIAYVCMLAVIFYRLSQPNHSKELDPFFGTIIFIPANLFFMPAWAALCFCVIPITEWYNKLWKQKVALNVLTCILVLFTFSPMFINHTSDRTYYPLAGFYLIAVSISTWLFSPIPLKSATNEENITSIQS